MRATMLCALLALAMSTAGCPGSGQLVDDDDATGDDDVSGDDDDTTATADPCDGLPADDPCCRERGPRLYLCMDWDWPDDTAVAGQFEGWGQTGEIAFVTGEGTSHPVWIEADPETLAMLPDLDGARVRVQQQGGCDGKGGFYSAVGVALAEEPDRVLLVTGSRGTDGLAGWTVEADRDVDGCPGRPGDPCHEWMHNRPVTFSRGDDGVQLYQGADVVDFGTRWAIVLGRAQSGSGDIDCSDVGTEYTHWFIVPRPEPEV